MNTLVTDHNRGTKIKKVFISAHGVPEMFDIESYDPNDNTDGVVGNVTGNVTPELFGETLAYSMEEDGAVYLLTCKTLGKTNPLNRTVAKNIVALGKSSNCKVIAVSGDIQVSGQTDFSPNTITTITEGSVFITLNHRDDEWVCEILQNNPHSGHLMK